MATTPYSESLTSTEFTQRTMLNDLMQQRGLLIGVGVGVGLLLLFLLRREPDEKEAARRLVRDWRNVDDVDDARDVLYRLTGRVREIQPVDADEEAGQSLARPGRRRDECVGTGGDVRPREALGFGRAFGKSAAEPPADRGMKPVDLGVGAQHELTRRRDECGGHRVILASPFVGV